MAFTLLSAIFADHASSCLLSCLFFSVAVLLSSHSSGQDDRVTETNAPHVSYIRGKGWINNAQILTAGWKDVSSVVDLLQSPLWCCCLLERISYAWLENELWGAMPWEPAKGRILCSLKWFFSLMLWLVTVPETWDTFLWGGGTSGGNGGYEDSSGILLEFVLLKSRTQWDGKMEMSREVISQTRWFLRAIMSQGLAIGSWLSSSWSLNQSLKGKSAKNLGREICLECFSC